MHCCQGVKLKQVLEEIYVARNSSFNLAKKRVLGKTSKKIQIFQSEEIKNWQINKKKQRKAQIFIRKQKFKQIFSKLNTHKKME